MSDKRKEYANLSEEERNEILNPSDSEFFKKPQILFNQLFSLEHDGELTYDRVQQQIETIVVAVSKLVSL